MSLSGNMMLIVNVLIVNGAVSDKFDDNSTIFATAIAAVNRPRTPSPPLQQASGQPSLQSAQC